jgi:hypothetical protein
VSHEFSIKRLFSRTLFFKTASADMGGGSNPLIGGKAFLQGICTVDMFHALL